MKEIELIVLTKSSKYGGYCVACVDIVSGKWVRLVSENVDIHGSLTDEQMTYKNGTKCKVLDVIKAYVRGNEENSLQPENYIVTKDKFVFMRRATLEEVLMIHPAENKDYIYGNAFPYITNKSMVENFGYSLILVKVNDLYLKKKDVIYCDNDEPDKETVLKKTKATFTYRSVKYEDMSVTDSDYYNEPDGLYGDAYIVVSIPAFPFHGSKYNNDLYYKFIAKIYPINKKNDELPF